MDSITASINAGLGGENNNVSIVGRTNTGGLVAPAFPNVCPGCGRCRDCGHPATPYVPPYQPLHPYTPITQPYWGPNVGTTTCEIKSTIPVAGGAIALNGTNS